MEDSSVWISLKKELNARGDPNNDGTCKDDRIARARNEMAYEKLLASSRCYYDVQMKLVYWGLAPETGVSQEVPSICRILPGVSVSCPKGYLAREKIGGCYHFFGRAKKRRMCIKGEPDCVCAKKPTHMVMSRTGKPCYSCDLSSLSAYKRKSPRVLTMIYTEEGGCAAKVGLCQVGYQHIDGVPDCEVNTPYKHPKRKYKLFWRMLSLCYSALAPGGNAAGVSGR